MTRVDTTLGTYVYPDEWIDDPIVVAIRKGDLHDWRVAEAMVRWWEPGTAILDVGCNLGQMSVCVGRATETLHGTAAIILSIEARARVAKLAERNLESNGSQGNVIHGAAWSNSGLDLPLSDIDFSQFASVGSLGVVEKAPTANEHSRSIVLSDLDQHGRVSVIKLDIQGSEYEALKGCHRLVERDSPVIIFEFEEMLAPRFGTTFADYIDLLDQYGYKIREVVGSNNYLAIPEARFRTEYLESFAVRRRRVPESEFMEMVRR